MHDDDPDDVVHNLFAHQAWGDTPLGRPIAGTDASITSMTRDPDPALLPAPLPRPTTWSSRSPATSTTPPSYARCGRRSVAAASSRARPTRPASTQSERAREVTPRRGAHHPPARAGQPRPRGQGDDPHRPPPLRPRRAQHRPRRRHLVADVPGGARAAAAWPTPSTPSPATTPTRASSASRSAACPASTPPCSRPCATSWPRSRPRASPTRRSSAARASSRAASCSGLEDSGSRMSRIGKAELVYDELLTIDEVVARIEAVTARGRRARSPGSSSPSPSSWRSSGPRVLTDRLSAWR